MKKLFLLLVICSWPLFAHASDIKCGTDTTGSGVINQINDCTAGSPFSYGGVTPAPTVANSNLCPINQTNCSLRQWRCDADTSLLGNAAPVYSDQTSCLNGCNWSGNCSSSQFTKTLSGSGTGTICVDSAMTIAVLDTGGGTAYRLVMKDTSPGGSSHWNCEPDIVNQGGEFGQHTPPIVDGWHNVLGTAAQPSATVDFTPYLPSSNGWDAWNSNIQFCVRHVWGTKGGGWCGVTDQPPCNCDTDFNGLNDAYCGTEQCVYQAGNAATFNYDWDPSPGSSIHSFIYRYSITVANNNYTCPIDSTAQCQGTAGFVTSSPAYYRVLKINAGTMGAYSSSACIGTCPANYADAVAQPANTLSTGMQTIAGTKQYYEFYLNLTQTFSPSASKTCTKQGICNPEPVCPTGYGCDCSSGTAPACPDNGTFVPNADNCQLQASSLCPAGFAYDAGVKGCVEPPTCANGTFNTSSNLCETAVTPTCAPGYAYNATSQQCEYTMSCPSGTSWDNTLKFCRTASTICPAGKAYNPATGQCTETATCQTGYSLNITSDKCEVAPSCLAGTAYSTTLDKCKVASTCLASTTLNTATDKCETAPSVQCASGYTYNFANGQCEAAPPCGTGFTYSTANNRCEKAATSSTTYSCPSGGTLSGTTCSYTATAYSTRSCVSGWTLKGSGTNTKCLQAASASSQCLGNYTLQGKTDTFWVQAGVSFTYIARACRNPAGSWLYGGWWDGTYYWNLPLPPGPTVGSYSAWEGSRQVSTCTAASNSCLGSGTISTGETVTLVGAVGPLRSIAYYTPNLVTTYSCPSGGTLSGTTCSYAATGTTTYSCLTGTLSGTICWQSVTCASGGLLNTTTDKCQLSATTSCITGTTYNSTTGKCEASPTCISGTAYDTANNLCGVAATCPSGGTLNAAADKCQLAPQCPTTGFAYSNTADLCQKAASSSCPASTAYDQATGYCSTTLTCPGSGTQDPTNGLLCSLNPVIPCPAGMAIGPVNGSTITCQQPADCPSTPFISSLDATIGKCKIGGADLCPTTWGWSSASDACTHTPICNGTTYDKTSKKCCACASANGCVATGATPTINDYSCSPNTCIDITSPGASVTSAVSNALNPTNDLGFSPVTGGCLGQVYIFPGQASTCRPQGWDTAGQDCCNGPSGPLLFGMGGGICQNNEVVTSGKSYGGLCHYVGDYCSNSWPAIGCVQTTKSYCCFDSKLARIIQEQGRPQLKRFNLAYCQAGQNCADPAIYWNTPTVPDCSGIRPEEFSSIDFSKIDISEFINDLQNQINGIVSDTQMNITNSVQQFFQNLKK